MIDFISVVYHGNDIKQLRPIQPSAIFDEN